MSSTFRHGILAATSSTAQSVGSFAIRSYGISVLAAGWDSRCLSILDAPEFRTEFAILIRFLDKGTTGASQAHERSLEAFLATRAHTVRLVDGDSRDIDGFWRRLRAELVNAWLDIGGGPTSCLLDLTSCPRYLTLGCLAFGVNRGMWTECTCLYREVEYQSQDEELLQHEMFTQGRWSPIYLPDLTGTYSPGAPSHTYVSVGFEGSKTLKLVAGLEPDRVSVLFPDPGFLPSYPGRTKQNNDELLRTFAIPDDQIVRAPAGDAVAAWKAMTEAAIERPEENTFYLCCGTKAHSLAVALRAMALQKTVVYARPDRHRESTIVPGNQVWMYEIHDVTVTGTPRLGT